MLITEASQREARLVLASRALNTISRSMRRAHRIMSESGNIEAFLREDDTVTESVLYLAAVGLDGEALPALDLEYRLSASQWDSMLTHCLGHALLNITKKVRTL